MPRVKAGAFPTPNPSGPTLSRLSVTGLPGATLVRVTLLTGLTKSALGLARPDPGDGKARAFEGLKGAALELVDVLLPSVVLVVVVVLEEVDEVVARP